mmetsp:Transcript_17523/g.59178  ORF Transcript_17523/g.59178 Transcript_17523/m.59178 type:complete len:161 (+) Transcript_17523:2249-2731(+)
MLGAMMAFYHAFDARDVEAMERIWHNEKAAGGAPHAVEAAEGGNADAGGHASSTEGDCANPLLPTCAHPGRPLARGFEAVMASWRGILRHPANSSVDHFGLGVSDVRVVAGGELGWATCRERVGDGLIQATNAFVQGPTGAWKIAHHHGSLEFQPADPQR